jgi:hypothetical protein
MVLSLVPNSDCLTFSGRECARGLKGYYEVSG